MNRLYILVLILVIIYIMSEKNNIENFWFYNYPYNYRYRYRNAPINLQNRINNTTPYLNNITFDTEYPGIPLTEQNCKKYIYK